METSSFSLESFSVPTDVPDIDAIFKPIDIPVPSNGTFPNTTTILPPQSNSNTAIISQKSTISLTGSTKDTTIPTKNLNASSTNATVETNFKNNITAPPLNAPTIPKKKKAKPVVVKIDSPQPPKTTPTEVSSNKEQPKEDPEKKDLFTNEEDQSEIEEEYPSDETMDTKYLNANEKIQVVDADNNVVEGTTTAQVESGEEISYPYFGFLVLVVLAGFLVYRRKYGGKRALNAGFVRMEEVVVEDNKYF